MKKILAVSLSVVMTVALAACGGAKQEAAPAAAAPAAAPAAAAPAESKAEAAPAAAAPAAAPAAAAPEAAAPADDYHLEMKLSHVFGPTEQLAISVQEAADNIREKSGGAIDIQCYHSSQLPTYKDGLEQVASGAKFISVEDPSYIGDYVPDFNVLVGPMMVSTYDEYDYLLHTETVQNMIKKLEDDNIKVLALNYFSGFRFMKTNKEIYTPEDLKGMKIRVPKSELFVNTLNAMGANAVPMGWDETLSACTQGVVDGLEGTMSDFVNDGSGEVASVGSLTNHFIGVCGIYFPLNVWNEMPEKYQKIVAEEFQAAGDRMVKTINDSYDADMETLKASGHTFNDVDVEAFAAAVKPVYDTIKGATPGMYDTLKGELAKMPK